MKTTIVIAKYKEDQSILKWVEEIDGFKTKNGSKQYNVIIYDKSHTFIDENQEYHDDVKRIHFFPNVGRESHTYIHHIITHYDQIASHQDDVTFFTQANLREHMLDVFKNRQYSPYEMNLKNVNECDYVHACCREAYSKGISESIAQIHDYIVPRMNRPSYSYRCIEWPKGTLMTKNIKDEAFGPWVKRCTKNNFRSDMKWFLGGIFAVKNKTIVARSKQFYEDLMTEFSDESNHCEVGHFFERSWYLIFNPDIHKHIL